MTADFLPLRLLLLTLAGWVNRHQQHVIDFLVEQHRILREQLRGRRVRSTDDHRRRLAAKGQRLGHEVLRQVATIVTPDPILRWCRRLIAQKWTSEGRRPGRPGLMKDRVAHRADGDRESSLVQYQAERNRFVTLDRRQAALGPFYGVSSFDTAA